MLYNLLIVIIIFFFEGVNSRGHRAQKIVQVRNSFFDDFLPPKMSLLQFVLKPNRC